MYFVSIPGEDSLVGYSRTCMDCDTVFGAVPDTYRGFSRDLRSPEELLTETFPNFHAAYEDLLALERKMPSQLTGDERRQRFIEPFMMIAEAAEGRFSHIKMDRISWYFVGGGLFVFFVAPWIVKAAGVNLDADPGWFLGLFFATFAAMFIALGLSGHRYAVSWALPRLARASATLRPADSELEDVLRELRSRNLRLGEKLRVADIQKAIGEQRSAL